MQQKSLDSITIHDLCKALLTANIYLNKLSNPCFKEFLSMYTAKDIPCESTLRKGYMLMKCMKVQFKKGG